ncbi:MAG: hypothetical protein HRU41_18335 [Saprospiraceae bacterium]|nr:hypothetical protein [Saprospiraceae bacterium]
MLYSITYRLFTSVILSLIFSTTLLAQTQVIFQVANIPSGLKRGAVGLRGSQAPLSWDSSLKMTQKDGNYQVVVEFPEETKELEFKFVLFDKDKKPTWEGINNRSLFLGNKETMTYEANWDEPAFIDPSTLSKLEPLALLQDFELIKTMLLEVHPGLYRYNDEAAIQQELAVLQQAFNTPITHGEAYLAISKLLASLQCGHTFASFFNQNGLIKSVIHWQQDKLPFTFRWVEDRMIVQYDATQDRLLPAGTEVLQINGYSTQEILDKLIPYISSDGAGRAARVAQLEVQGFDFRYDAFDVFHPLVFPLDQAIWTLKIRKIGATDSEELVIPTITIAERYQTLINRYPTFPKDRNAMLSYEIKEEGVGVLKLGSFGLMGWKRLTKDYKAFYKEAFTAFAKQQVKHLIIDIRDNMGGNDEMKDELATYFNVDRFIDNSREGRTRYLHFPESLKAYIQSWGNPWYYDLSTDKPEEEDGYYIFPRSHSINQKNKKKPSVFKGEVYLLTSPRNGSLAYYLAKDFKTFEIGTSLGQETDGNLRGINGGQILFLRLPNSGIEIDFPVMGDFSLTPQANQGVQPDIPIQVKVEDVQGGIDTEMEYILRMIRQGQRVGKRD